MSEKPSKIAKVAVSPSIPLERVKRGIEKPNTHDEIPGKTGYQLFFEGFFTHYPAGTNMNRNDMHGSIQVQARKEWSNFTNTQREVFESAAKFLNSLV